MKNLAFTLLVGGLLVKPCWAQPENAESLRSLVRSVQSDHPRVHQADQLELAALKRRTFESTLQSPVVGVSELHRGARTKYWVVSQKFRFPYKYFLENKRWSHEAKVVQVQNSWTRRTLVIEVIQSYFEILVLQKKKALIEVNINLVREMARVAERRYASRRSSQADSMQAHLTLTELQVEKLDLETRVSMAQSRLESLIGRPGVYDFTKSKVGLPNQEVWSTTLARTQSAQGSGPWEVQVENHRLKSQGSQKDLANWGWAPDFEVKVQKVWQGEPSESHIYSLGMSIPLWFWKTSAQVDRAHALWQAGKYRLEDTRRRAKAQIEALLARIKGDYEMLKIYEGSLIPQAEGAYRVARSGYRASQVSFVQLLASERNLIRLKKAYWSQWNKWVKNLNELDLKSGTPVSEILIEGVWQ